MTQTVIETSGYGPSPRPRRLSAEGWNLLGSSSADFPPNSLIRILGPKAGPSVFLGQRQASGPFYDRQEAFFYVPPPNKVVWSWNSAHGFGASVSLLENGHSTLCIKCWEYNVEGEALGTMPGT